MNKSPLVAVLVILLILGGVWFFWGRGSQRTLTKEQPIATVLYSCNGGKTITAAYYKGAPAPAPAPGQPPKPTGSVALTLSDGRELTLAQTISADGVRYSDGNPMTQGSETFVFWSKGNGALVLENNVEKSYIGCIAVAPAPEDGSLPRMYSNSGDGFSIRLPADYTINESYRYQELGPGKDISGIKFTIATSTAEGTNLGSDTYISVEEIPQVSNCSAALFLDQGVRASEVTEGGTTYSVASSTGAAAGNRYEETVYAFPDTNPCIAVRYVIHYGVFENYPPGAVRQFDERALLDQFDAIRRTLVLDQGDYNADYKNTTYTIEKKPVMLSNGYAEQSIAPGSASKTITQYFGNDAFGDPNGDGQIDVAFLLTQNSGGSGTFYYIVVALKTESGYQGTNAILLGDRIAPQTTEIRDGQIIVNYAVRKTGEPMTTPPSVGVSKYLVVQGTTLKEASSTPI